MAQVARALALLEAQDGAATETLQWLELAEQPPDPSVQAPVDSPWTLEAEALLALREICALTWPPTIPSTASEFQTLMIALQLLDAWHRPIAAQLDGRVFMRLGGHNEALDRLVLEGYFGRDVYGSIIPRYTDEAWPVLKRARGALRDHPTNPMRSAPGRAKPRLLLLQRLMDNTAYLPAEVEALNPDGGLTNRVVKLRYRRPETFNPLREPSRGPKASTRVAIAPLLENLADGGLELTPCQTRYGVAATYPFTRIKSAIEMAVREGAELLLFPETSIPETELDRVRDAVGDAVDDYQRATLKIARLQFVFAGIVGARPAPDDFHRNFVVVMDRSGQVLMRQDKLFRWDITKKQVQTFGLEDRLGFKLRGPNLRENIEVGEAAEVVDLSGLGRVIHMICADADFNLPGDWLLQHFCADWLHAPIMDLSIGPVSYQRGEPRGPWISKRADRAARYGPTHVMVTNSMLLTHIVNDENKKRKLKRSVIDPCCIALMVQPGGKTPKHIRVEAPLGGDSPVLAIVDWNGRKWTTPRFIAP